MRLRPRRRNLVVWSSHPGAAAGYGMPRFTQPMRPRRLRPCIRACALLTVIGLLGLARGVRARWRPVLAGVVFTAVGLVLRSGPGGVLLLPGLMFLLTAPLLPANSKADRARCSELARELGAYSTASQRHDLGATFDRYPDGITRELRDILARQIVATGNNRIPGTGEY
jgi:hypothetical protein